MNVRVAIAAITISENVRHGRWSSRELGLDDATGCAILVVLIHNFSKPINELINVKSRTEILVEVFEELGRFMKLKAELLKLSLHVRTFEGGMKFFLGDFAGTVIVEITEYTVKIVDDALLLLLMICRSVRLQ